MPIMLPVVFLGGAIAAGVSYLQEKDLPVPFVKPRTKLIVYLGNELRPEADPEDRFVERVNLRYQKFFQERIDPLLGASRQHDLAELAPTTQLLERPDGYINRRLGYSVIAIFFAIAGSLSLPSFLVVSVAVGLYANNDLYFQGTRNLLKGKPDHLTTAMLAMVTSWIGGFWIANSLASLLYYTGEKLAAVSENRARQRMIDVFGQIPRTARVILEGEEIEISVSALKEGDVVIVRAGQIIPVDGEITQGMASIDQHMLTGESQPVEKEVGAGVFASTLLLSGEILITITRTGTETVASQIVEVLNNTANFQFEMVNRGKRIANAWALPTILIGLAGGLVGGIRSLVALWNVDVGSQIMITAPISLLNFLDKASANGILVKDGRSLELLKLVDTVVFDKTGTLTEERPTVAAVHSFSEFSSDTILQVAAAAESHQSHPIAHAILHATKERGLEFPAVEKTDVELGYGLRVMLEGHEILVGSQRFMAMSDVELPIDLEDLLTQTAELGHSMVFVAVDAQLIGAIELQPTVRPEAYTVIANLQERGIKTVIISGDQEAPTRKLAHQLGIDEYFANTLPENKAQLVEMLQSQGRKVCFVGDGINDSIALRKADVSVSIHGATTIAVDTAQIVLMSKNLEKLPYLFELSHTFNRNARVGTLIATVPAFILIGGVFILNLGVYASIAFWNIGLVAGMLVAMSPSLSNTEQDKQQALPQNSRVALGE